MTVEIDGMHCQACVARVRKALDRVIDKVDSAKVERVDVGSAEVTIDSLLEPVVLDAIRNAGYEARAKS